MESYTIKNLNFSYPDQNRKTLDNISLSIKKGEFVVLCGQSGSGKTTLLRQLKTALAPHGFKTGSILFENENLDSLNQRKQTSKIGFVLQSPENQIVTDKVWHELAFGLESLGYDTPTIRLRVAEMASFFGIQNWFNKDVIELSGGQKQILNLAAVMVMQPSVLILDEPTSQLDPIAAADFLVTISKINRELGTTIILTEHRLDDAMPLADKVVVLDKGKIIANDTPAKVGEQLKAINHKMFLAMPTPMRIYAGVKNNLDCPITVGQGRVWMDNFAKDHKVKLKKEDTGIISNTNTVVEVKNLSFKYEKLSEDILKNVSLKVSQGELYTILGGNGAGKTTILSLISGINTPYRGEVIVNGSLGALPQDPQSLFVKKTTKLELYQMSKNSKEVKQIASLCKLTHLMNQHPYDLSGGEQQRLALAKVLLLGPEILLLDEPTKGMDAKFKQTFANILSKLQSKGVTIIMVSHDIEFCAQYADKCALFFNGDIVTSGTRQEFFTGNNFYTTAANRMVRHLEPKVVTVKDAIEACGGNVKYMVDNFSNDKDDWDYIKKKSKVKLNPPKEKEVLNKGTIMATILILFIIPLTIYIGNFYLGDRKYYFISLLIILEISLAFMMIFEDRKPKARELVVIAVLCAIAVASRAAFFMIPQFKPVAAIVIITGVAFGGESGFLVGSLTMFLSNIMYGQGPLTPWQMFAMGIIGFIAGVLFKRGLLKPSKISLAIYGGVSVFFIYGGIMNPASVLITQANVTWPMIISSLLVGAPFDLIHASATVFFLVILGEPMLEKLDRVKTKYGLVK